MSREIKKYFILFFWLACPFLVGSCSGLEKSEKDKIRERNLKGEFIYRNHNELLFTVPPIKKRTREPYPWELPAPKKETAAAKKTPSKKK